jgi:hypothetical protein
MTVYKAPAWTDATDGTFYPPNTSEAVAQDGKTLDEVRRHLAAHGMTLVGTCAREHGGEAELWGDQWPRYDGNGKIFAIWEEQDAVSHV